MRKRILTALFGLPPVIWIITRAPEGFVFGFFSLLEFLLALEIMRLISLPKDAEGLKEESGETAKPFLGFRKHEWALALLSLVSFVATSLAKRFDSLVVFAFVTTVFMLGAALFPAPIPRRVFRTEAILLAMTYAVIPWVIIWYLYCLSLDGRFIILLMALAWLGDTSAFLIGKTWGKRRLAAKVSPNKTWLGAVSGLTATVFGALLVPRIYAWELGPWPSIILLGLACGIAGQLGDLFKSVFKRYRGVKDSGWFVPGHGGLLDRMDSILLSAPVLLLFVTFFR